MVRGPDEWWTTIRGPVSGSELVPLDHSFPAGSPGAMDISNRRVPPERCVTALASKLEAEKLAELRCALPALLLLDVLENLLQRCAGRRRHLSGYRNLADIVERDL